MAGQDLRSSSPRTSGPSRRGDPDTGARVDRRRRDGARPRVRAATPLPDPLLREVAGHDIPIVCNVVASRRALAFALGVDERGLAAEYARRIKDTSSRSSSPIRRSAIGVLTGPTSTWRSFPIPRYFPGDAGRYLTAGMLVARDPDTGVETEGYHRFQLKGRTDGREPAFAATDVRVSAAGRGQGPGAAVRRRAGAPSARVDGLARVSAARRRQVRGRGRAPRRAPARSRRARPSTSTSPRRPRSSSRARSWRACASPRARSASSPATSRGARPSTSSWQRRSRCASGRGSSRSARAARATTSPRSA